MIRIVAALGVTLVASGSLAAETDEWAQTLVASYACGSPGDIEAARAEAIASLVKDGYTETLATLTVNMSGKMLEAKVGRLDAQQCADIRSD